jgi:hypothetical protein
MAINKKELSMNRLFLNAALLVTIAALPLQAAPQATEPSAASASTATVLTAADAGKILPPAVFFHGQSAPVQARNSGGVRLTKDSYMLVALVDNSGYSSQVQQKYQAYLIAEEPLDIGGHRLAPGAYGCGFIAGDLFLVMDIGGHELFSVPSTKDAGLHRPTPLQVLSAPEGGQHYRLYSGRNFVAFSPANQ